MSTCSTYRGADTGLYRAKYTVFASIFKYPRTFYKYEPGSEPGYSGVVAFGMAPRLNVKAVREFCMKAIKYLAVARVA